MEKAILNIQDEELEDDFENDLYQEKILNKYIEKVTK